MEENILSVREITADDIDLIIDYWTHSSIEFLMGMGVDLDKLPSREQWKEMLTQQLSQDYAEKQSYCIIWLLNGKAIGHSNVNKITFGQDAYMHLHLWNAVHRNKGFGVTFVKMSVPYFFKNLQLKKIFSEPYALNVSPNITLQKLDFTFVKEYMTTPGSINFEQLVKKWVLSAEKHHGSI